MSRRRLRPLSNPDLRTERRSSLLAIAGLVSVSSVALWLLHLSVATIVGLELALVALLVVRLFGPGELSSDQEFAAILSTEFTHQVATTLRHDQILRGEYVRAGLQADSLLALPATALARSAAVLRAQGAPGRTGFSLAQRVVTTSGAFAVVVVALTLARMRSPACGGLGLLSSSTGVILLAFAALVSGSRVAVLALNRRTRATIRTHLARPGAVPAELAGMLANVWSGRRQAFVADLNELCVIATAGFQLRRAALTAALQRMPSLLLGALLGLLTMLVFSWC